jgi:hypothetical protein
LYNEVNAAADYCFGSPNLSGAPACGQVVDLGAQALGAYLGYDPNQIPPVGSWGDGVIAGIHFFEDMDVDSAVETLEENPSLIVIGIILILYVPVLFLI